MPEFDLRWREATRVLAFEFDRVVANSASPTGTIADKLQQVGAFELR